MYNTIYPRWIIGLEVVWRRLKPSYQLILKTTNFLNPPILKLYVIISLK